MKKTGMAKSDAKKLMGKMAAPGAAVFGNAGNAGNADNAVVDRKELRERERALGLVPFAVKLNADLVKQLQEHAKTAGVDLNEAVASLLVKGLAS
ncbi:hypothetical protein [Massilia sp. TWP1-3-3]|uniref:hypothetical protein n=1 Tax=Massilia sp. TWP1-3-3 TaxID=2804573 RepID=UPI003CF3E74D